MEKIRTLLGYTWYLNGKNIPHKLDGPACIHENISGINKEYFIDGKRYYNFLEYIQAVMKYKKA